MFDPQDTIVALSSAFGPGARGIVRLSGKDAWSVIDRCFRPQQPWPQSIRRGCWQGTIELPDLTAGLPAQALVWPGPRSYTGQDLIELHTISSPPILEALIAHLMHLGARAAQPGEFTVRAFLAGKLDLTQAEAVLGVIEADTRDELQTALGQLAGGMARPLQGLRDSLLDLLAEVEAGLDFAEEDLQFVSRDQLLERVRTARQVLVILLDKLKQRTISGRPFRVVLAGPPNAGKSSLFNALAGKPLALVSPEPGTTRDYLVHRFDLDGTQIELVDTAGREEVEGENQGDLDISQQAQAARRLQSEQADLLLICHDATQLSFPDAGQDSRSIAYLPVFTKCDLLLTGDPAASEISHWLQTSAARGWGIVELRTRLAEQAREAKRPPVLAPSWSRCRHHVEACIEHLQQGEAIVAEREPPEFLALELRLALDELGRMVGAIYTDDLLDRIFSQFCIGK